MKREEKFPNTDTFVLYNANPKNRYTSDCVFRALSTACEIEYNKVVFDGATMQCETGYDSSSKKGIEKLLDQYGWTKMKQPKTDNNKKYTGKEFCKLCKKLNDKKYNKIVAMIGGNHIVAIIDYKIHDTWDSSDYCIGNYWIKNN